MSLLLRGFICFGRGILCIHPSFRIIGLAEPPVVGSSQQQWLNSELLSMFLFHHVRPLSKQEEAQVIYDMVREIKSVALRPLYVGDSDAENETLFVVNYTIN